MSCPCLNDAEQATKLGGLLGTTTKSVRTILLFSKYFAGQLGRSESLYLWKKGSLKVHTLREFAAAHSAAKLFPHHTSCGVAMTSTLQICFLHLYHMIGSGYVTQFLSWLLKSNSCYKLEIGKILPMANFLLMSNVFQFRNLPLILRPTPLKVSFHLDTHSSPLPPAQRFVRQSPHPLPQSPSPSPTLPLFPSPTTSPMATLLTRAHGHPEQPQLFLNLLHPL